MNSTEKTPSDPKQLRMGAAASSPAPSDAVAKKKAGSSDGESLAVESPTAVTAEAPAKRQLRKTADIAEMAAEEEETVTSLSKVQPSEAADKKQSRADEKKSESADGESSAAATLTSVSAEAPPPKMTDIAEGEEEEETVILALKVPPLDSLSKQCQLKEMEVNADLEQNALGIVVKDAKKGVLFINFLPVLQLQLKRFDYDFMRDAMVKNDFYFGGGFTYPSFRYPEESRIYCFMFEEMYHEFRKLCTCCDKPAVCYSTECWHKILCWSCCEKGNFPERCYVCRRGRNEEKKLVFLPWNKRPGYDSSAFPIKEFPPLLVEVSEDLLLLQIQCLGLKLDV
ncbi:Ubiquitin carboxyl-terminal hydrolase 12 [Acorus gramineus]|uniref:Ubiquitin carboxyl-terminal hydrolase 12 n=1 Tax=Acorus gramineus TaxID=55184 RepID=A0AAV9B9J4_ACOGR|nr:Ubiquitin carboxyl-terminal hydrolase 12 [Acorus gramineus]